ncbi:unnamed protein product [marine sediment metagenome]|uniref:Uncharacterized protein n=1 Tax=marine sediment metagenome TaxID=412755 RepID=X1U1V8_9ZZZZ
MNKNKNLEHAFKKEEICVGHLIIKYKIVCEKCEQSDDNKYCSYYQPYLKK